MSRFSEAKGAGFLLAAVLAGDRELARVRAQLRPAEHMHLRARAEAAAHGDARTQVGSASDAERVRLLRWLFAHVRPALAQLPTGLPARMAALLARHLPPEQAQAALASAPLARASFEPSADLTSRILRIARRQQEAP